MPSGQDPADHPHASLWGDDKIRPTSAWVGATCFISDALERTGNRRPDGDDSAPGALGCVDAIGGSGGHTVALGIRRLVLLLG